ncbi:WG repeat-containing protein [Cecembia rubra]|uniref:WG repeat-containing protein n=1 Tax=Cecembia rubra TaxID=1485585 RepID=UPI002714CDF9|nr:WG repeat-containing protein [Cecembia rubra]
MKCTRCWGAVLITALILSNCPESLAQTYEVYDQNLKLKSRLEFDQIAVLSESVRISTANNEVKLLSREYKPFINLQAEKVEFYDQPWLIVRGNNGLGAFHEYGENILPTDYDEIQTFFTRLLAKKGNQYWVYDHSTKETTFIGSFEKAILATNGQVIAKNSQGYLLPLSKNPDKVFEDLRQINENFIISKESSGFGMINREGEYVLQPVIDHIVHLEDDYFYAFDGNQYMLIRGREGKANISYSSYHKITLEDGVLLEYIHGRLRRVMKNDGILLDQVGMEKVNNIGDKYYNVLMRDKKIGLLGPNGWEVHPVDGVDKILPGNEGIYGAMKSGKYGFIDKSGKWLIPAQFDQVKKFNEGLAAYQLNGQWGILDKWGNIIVPAQFSQISEFRRGLAIVRTGEKQNIVDRTGKLLIEKSYDRISLGADNYFISENNTLFGLIAPDGKEIIEPKFQEIRREELNKILVRFGDKYGIMDENGDYLLPIYYKNIVFDQGSRQILAEDEYQFMQVIEEIPGKRKRTGK